MSTASQVTKLYRTVVEDVINNVKEAFLDEGIDEQVLQELKQLWEGKLSSSKALEPPPAEREAVLQPQNMTLMLPQPIQASTTQEQGAVGQSSQVQPTTQYQISPAAATATLSLFQQQFAALGAGGQIQNITVQQTGAGQYITLAGIPPQQIQQLQQQHITPQMLQQQQQQQQQIRISQQPQHIRITQPQTLQQQQPKLVPAGQILQQSQTTVPSQVNKSQGGIHQSLIQLDGNGDTSSSEEDFDDDDKDEDDKEEENEEEEQGEEEEPLNTDDDVSEDDPTDLFDTDNVVVCQYDKINRNKNRWKFHLKDGIMNLDGRDYVFQKAVGDSEW